VSSGAVERYFRLPLAFLLATSLLAMMALVFIDVFGRYFFGAPIRGSYEITQCLMALVVFFGFPLVTEAREHITVGLFQEIGGAGFRRWRRIAIDALSAGVVVFMGLRLWEQGEALARSAQVSGLTNIPIAPFAFFMSVMSFLGAAVFLAQATLRAGARP